MNQTPDLFLAIVESILPAEDADNIRSLLGSNQFPWFYEPSSTRWIDIPGRDKPDRPWLFHLFFGTGLKANSPYSDFILDKFSPLFDFVGHWPDQVRASMELRQTPGMNYYHVDRDSTHFSAVYYVKDADGNTCFGTKDPIEVEPRFNSVAIFDGSILHCNRFPVENDRCIINFIFDAPFPAHLKSADAH